MPEDESVEELIARLDDLRAKMGEVRGAFADQPRLLSQILDNIKTHEQALLKLIDARKIAESK